LTRRGLLVPIIDGFDELLGAAGYGDAFGSLREFLSDLNGSGVVVVSARSSFYDVEFLTRQSDGPSAAIHDLTPITLRRWGNEEIKAYLHKVGKMTDALADSDFLSQLSGVDQELLGKPFFASKFPDYLDAIGREMFDGTMIEFLIQSYIRREAEKIVDRDGRVLLPLNGHRRFFEETADLMWTNESRWLSKDDLRVLAELIADESKLSSDAARQLITKITSYAGFSMTRAGQFALEHDVYFDYFLSSVLKRQLLTTLNESHLDRGILPTEVAEAAVDRTSVADMVFVKILPTLDGSLRHENRRRNAGLLVAVAARILGKILARRLYHLSMVNVDLDGVEFEDVEFADCTFSGVSFRSAKFKRCRCVNTHAYSISVSSDTELGLAGVEPGENLHSISVIGESTEEFSPRRMREILAGLGAPVRVPGPEEIKYTRWQADLISLFGKVVHKYRRTNVLCVEEDPGTSAIAHHTLWPTLKRIMIDTEVVREETRATSGRRKEFLRPTVSMEELAACETSRELPRGPIGRFWEEVRKHRS
jgi:hypothetical protein